MSIPKLSDLFNLDDTPYLSVVPISGFYPCLPDASGLMGGDAESEQYNCLHYYDGPCAVDIPNRKGERVFCLSVGRSDEKPHWEVWVITRPSDSLDALIANEVPVDAFLREQPLFVATYSQDANDWVEVITVSASYFFEANPDAGPEPGAFLYHPKEGA